ncbi:MAG TPA: enoyl-CoA hydratase/isomerase family protein [Acidimicrobiia bacterium]|nr:enoyl-CoA hydratase/isomerase family protein [Acidimicrobiia bacterium]
MTEPREFATLTVERRGAVCELTLCRPEIMNRFDDPLHVEFTAALRAVAADSETRAVVLASTGKVFSAGGDFEIMRTAHDDPAARRRIVDDGRALLTTLVDLPQPVVAAVQGPAVGLGATVALACDAVVAARSAWIADTHVNIGLVAGDGGCVVWPQSIGMLLARRHLLTGDRLEAERAWQLGVVSDLVDGPDDVLPAARALAERIAALPPLAVQGTKRALNRVSQQRVGEVLDLSFAHETATLASDDLLEAIAAFEERRPGRYDGR